MEIYNQICIYYVQFYLYISYVIKVKMSNALIINIFSCNVIKIICIE